MNYLLVCFKIYHLYNKCNIDQTRIFQKKIKTYYFILKITKKFKRHSKILNPNACLLGFARILTIDHLNFFSLEAQLGKNRVKKGHLNFICNFLRPSKSIPSLTISYYH